MTKFKSVGLGIIAAAAVALTATVAQAAQSTAAVAEVLPDQRVLALDDGKRFTVHTQVDLKAVKSGDQVSVTYIDPMPIFRWMGFDGFATDVAPVTS
jgi:hypothetical protein